MRNLKIKNWEFWPSFMFYLPNIPYACFLAIKARSLVFFSATNPGIKFSGNGCESKYETTQLIPEIFRPTSIFIKSNTTLKIVIKNISENSIKYPFIIKPDIGFRGLLVKKISSEKELENYLKLNKNLNLIIQEFIDFENECGIFYHRLPNRTKGTISSITLKKYLTVKGDGVSTLKELIINNSRARLYKQLLFELLNSQLENILKKGESKVLSVIGNHAKGTQFINGNALISLELQDSFDKLFDMIPGVYFGRVDLKYNSFEELKQLKNFKIIEINGIISEPTHIYDSKKGNYFKAVKEIRKHWNIIYNISKINHSKLNVPYYKITDFLDSLIKLNKYISKLKKRKNDNSLIH